MTKSAELIAKVRRETSLGPNAGTNLAYLAAEMANEYEIAIKQNLEMEQTIHEWTKAHQGVLGI